jgi:hypothetical protein
MTRKYKSAVWITSFWLTAAILFTGETNAGQFKRMTGSSTLAVNGNLAAHASPRNQGAAMEMDTYEWQSQIAGAASYRCRITSNTTGQTLNLKFLGVNGTVVDSCSAVNNGTCNTGTHGLVANLLFQCVTSTANGNPVNGTAHYIFAVRRTL